MRKTILVTGGAGFIGTNLVKKLLALGHLVILVDNFYSSSPEKLKLFSLNKKCHFVKCDIRKPLKIEEKIDDIYNLACPASPPIYQKDPVFTLETNVLGIKNIINLAIKHNARLLQASTSEVYGNPLVHPQSENYWGNTNPIGQRSCYDEGKRIAETYCCEYFRKGVDIRIIRIFNTYGPYMDPNDGRVVSNFIVQALNNQNLTIYGDGNQTRSFCYVEDLIKGMMRYMDLEERFLGPINLGNPGEFTVLELAQLVKKFIPGSRSELVFKPLPTDDPVKRRPDISLARTMLRWEPKIKLREGLIRTVKYFRDLVGEN